jgi:methionine-rich copper-binding protein CopC
MRTRPPRRLRVWLIVLAGAVAGLAVPTAAAAHANLASAEPPADAMLREGPATLTLTFTQAVVPSGSWVQVRDSNDQPIPLQSFAASGKSMHVEVAGLKPDIYTVKWQTLSAEDDDYADGSYRITVLMPDGSLPPAARAPAQSPSTGNEPLDGGSSLTMLVLASLLGVTMVGGAIYFAMRRGRPAE